MVMVLIVWYVNVSIFSGNEEKSLALPDKVLESLLSQTCAPTEVVLQLKQTLQLDQASLEQPEPRTKTLIRCLATKAKHSNRLDVVKHLREITPAGTTGECASQVLEQFSIECCKTKIKVITLTIHSSRKQSNEPIRINQSLQHYMAAMPSTGKCVRASHDWFWS